MSNIEVQISPRGLKQKNLVDCLYAVVSSIKGICAKLDDDGGVPSATYEANVYTAIFNGYLENSRDDKLINQVTANERYFFTARPTGIDNRALIQCIYQIFDMMETLTEQLDGDSLGDTNYEALVYAAHYLWTVQNEIGNTVGASTEQWITPKGVDDSRQLVDMLYCFVHSIDTLTKKLDLDGTVTDTTYHALWDTANILMQVEDSKGNIAGNALTKFNP